METEADNLLARVAFRHLERVTVRGRPDGLHHVPEVEAREAKLLVAVVPDGKQRAAHTTMAAQTASIQACARASAVTRVEEGSDLSLTPSAVARFMRGSPPCELQRRGLPTEARDRSSAQRCPASTMSRTALDARFQA